MVQEFWNFQVSVSVCKNKKYFIWQQKEHKTIKPDKAEIIITAGTVETKLLANKAIR